VLLTGMLIPSQPLKELNRILCVKEEHRVRNDFTIVHDGKFYQIEYNVQATYDCRGRKN
jgi:hypothetical protein